jgi:Uma2 family endonuclease
LYASARPRRMQADEFIAWAADLPKGERYELAGGEIVAMAAERAAHVRAKFAATAALKAAIKAEGLPCEAFVDGLAVRIDDEHVYEPNALVRCGEPLDPDTVTIDDPVIVVEVVSPSSSRIDADGKLGDYFQLASVKHYLIVNVKRRLVVHHARESADRIATRILRDGPLELRPPGLSLRVESLLG